MSGHNVPIGWEDRNNQMSEHDMKLGGIAATKFASKKSVGAYDGDDISYKTSDQVKQHYMAQIEAEENERQQKNQQPNNEQPPSMLSSTSSSSALPSGWEQRQKSRAVEEKQYGVFAKKNSSVPPVKSANDENKTNITRKAELALLQVATHTLDTLATTLEHQPSKIPMEDRTAFAAAMKRALDAMAKC